MQTVSSSVAQFQKFENTHRTLASVCAREERSRACTSLKKFENTRFRHCWDDASVGRVATPCVRESLVPLLQIDRRVAIAHHVSTETTAHPSTAGDWLVPTG